MRLSRDVEPPSRHKQCLRVNVATHEHKSPQLFHSLLRFITIGDDRNKDRFETDSFTVFESFCFANTERWSSRTITFSLPIHVSTSLLRFPSPATQPTALALLDLLQYICAYLLRALSRVSGEKQYLGLYSANVHSCLVARC